jgi:hypothetical protein
MRQPLFAAFPAGYAFSQNSRCQVAVNFSSVLEAVRDSLGRAVDTNSNSIDLHIDDSLRERLTGESDEAQLELVRYYHGHGSPRVVHEQLVDVWSCHARRQFFSFCTR